jgi:hypothetical protein
MRLLGCFLGLFLIFNLALVFPPAASSDDWSESRLKDAVDVFLTAVGSQSPDPGFATALSAAPGGTKVGLLKKCNKNMLEINDELEDNPPAARAAKLLEKLDRNHAVFYAINGDPKPLQDFENFKKKQEQKRKKQAVKKKKKTYDEIKEMNDELARIHRKIDVIYNDSKKDIQSHIKMMKEFPSLAKQINEFYKQIQVHLEELKDFNKNKNNNNPCFKVKEYEKKIKAYSVRILDNKKIYYKNINQANKRLKSCKNNYDILFIKSSFETAKSSAAKIEKDSEKILDFLSQRETLHKEYEKLIKDFNKKNKERFKIKNITYNKIVDQADEYYQKILDTSKRLVPQLNKMEKIKIEISRSQNYYIKRYPASKIKNAWKDLSSRASRISEEIREETDNGLLDDHGEQLKRALSKIRKILNEVKDYGFNACDKDFIADKAADAALKIKAGVFKDLIANGRIPDLADACQSKKTPSPVKDSKSGGKKSPSKVTPPAVVTKPPSQTTPSTANSTDIYSGGLRIIGKSRLISGEGATYIATDGAGKPYKGGVSWTASVDNVFVMGSDGSGVAFKPGNCTLIAHKDDMTAFFDIQVVEEVKSSDSSDKSANEKKMLLAQTDCSQWEGAQPVWDKKNNRPACACVNNMVLNENKTKCIDRKTAILEKSDCSFYPNTKPVWDTATNRVKCDCLPGYVWNQDRTACIDRRQAELESVDCSQFPGSVAVWDDRNNKPACKCPQGTQWSKSQRRCMSEKDIALASADCSYLPGSGPEWDYPSKRVVCKCQSPYIFDAATGRCIDTLDSIEQMADDYERERAQREKEFQRELEENRRRDQKQYEANLQAMNDIFSSISKPNQYPPASGHTERSTSGGRRGESSGFSGASSSQCPSRNPGTKLNITRPPNHGGNYVYCRYYKNGQLAQQVPYKNKKREGWDIGYFSNGQLKSRTQNRNGCADGPFVVFQIKNGKYYKAREGMNKNCHQVKGSVKRYPAPK